MSYAGDCPSWHDGLGEIASRNYALDQDVLVSARQIRQPIVKTDDILNAFDGITYLKGASVLDTALGLLLDDRIDIRETQFLVLRARDEINRRTSMQLVRDHKDEILKRIPTDGTAGDQSFLAYVFTEICRAEQRDEIADYVTKMFAGLPGGERTVKQAIEEMDQCIARRTLVEPEIRRWLGGPSATTRTRSRW